MQAPKLIALLITLLNCGLEIAGIHFFLTDPALQRFISSGDPSTPKLFRTFIITLACVIIAGAVAIIQALFANASCRVLVAPNVAFLVYHLGIAGDTLRDHKFSVEALKGAEQEVFGIHTFFFFLSLVAIISASTFRPKVADGEIAKKGQIRKVK